MMRPPTPGCDVRACRLITVIAAIGAAAAAQAAGISSPLLDAAGQVDPSFLQVTTDPEGNVYYCGSRESTSSPILDFDPGPGTTGLNLSDSQRVFFVVKADAALNLEWLRILRIPEGPILAGTVHADATGNVYVVVYANPDQTIDFGEPGDPFLVPVGDDPGRLIWKINAEGTTQWVAAFNAEFGVTEIGTGPDGSVHLLGTFTVDTDFNPGPDEFELSTFTALYGAYRENAVVVKLTAAGQFVWARHFAETNTTPGLSRESMAVGPDGSVYVASSFSQQVDADPGIGTQRFFTNPVGDTDTLLVRLNASGNLVWATQYVRDGLSALRRDNSGGLLMLHFREHITRYLQTGVFEWSRTIDTPSASTNVNDLVAGDDGDFYIGGGIQSTGDIGTGPGDMSNLLLSPGTTSAWIARWDLGGTQLWCTRLPSIDSTGFSFVRTQIHFANGHVLAIEEFDDSIDVNPLANAQQVLTPLASFDGTDTAFIKLRSADGLWLDFDTTTARQMDGSLSFPLRTLQNAVRAVQPGGTINIVSAGAGIESPATGTFSKPARIDVVGGPVRIGVQP